MLESPMNSQSQGLAAHYGGNAPASGDRGGKDSYEAQVARELQWTSGVEVGIDRQKGLPMGERLQCNRHGSRLPKFEGWTRASWAVATKGLASLEVASEQRCQVVRDARNEDGTGTFRSYKPGRARGPLGGPLGRSEEDSFHTYSMSTVAIATGFSPGSRINVPTRQSFALASTELSSLT